MPDTFPKSDIVSCIGGLTVGVLANVYGRITRSSSFVVGITGILYLVPSGIAAAGASELRVAPASGRR